MAIQARFDGVVIEVRVKPSSGRFRLTEREGVIILEVTSPPVEGRANTEIVKTLKKMTGKDVQILRGLKSKSKTILISDSTIEEVKSLIES